MNLKNFTRIALPDLFNELLQFQTEKVVADQELVEAERRYKLHVQRKNLLNDFEASFQKFTKKMIDAKDGTARASLAVDFNKKALEAIALFDKIQVQLEGKIPTDVQKSRASVQTQVDKVGSMLAQAQAMIDQNAGNPVIVVEKTVAVPVT